MFGFVINKLKKLGHTVYIVTVNDSIIKHEYDEKEKITPKTCTWISGI